MTDHKLKWIHSFFIIYTNKLKSTAVIVQRTVSIMESLQEGECGAYIEHQEQLLQDGDGLQVICDHFQILNKEEGDEVVVNAPAVVIY